MIREDYANEAKKRKFFYRLWPPYEAKISNKKILEKIHHLFKDDAWKTLCDKSREPLQHVDEEKLKDIESFVRNIYTDEFKRKDVLENKASAFFVSNGILVGVLSIIPTLISSQIYFYGNVKCILVAIYALSFFHLIMAVYYAIKVREADIVACFTSAVFEEYPQIMDIKERIAMTLALIRFNEYALLIKANHLCTAERFFIRGLSFISLTIASGIVLTFL